MNDILQKIALCIERGKINLKSPFPPDMKDQEGAIELTAKALQEGISAHSILNEALMAGMKVVGERFRDNKIFVPDVLIAAKAMKGSMELLKPYFLNGEIKHKGTIAMGTVRGDLHDIGKNIVSMVIEGGGWKVVDLGIDVSVEKFLSAIENESLNAIGISALLTTTMQNMESIIKTIKEQHPEVKVLVGGAPLSKSFAEKINADCFSQDPQGALDYLNSVFS